MVSVFRISFVLVAIFGFQSYLGAFGKSEENWSIPAPVRFHFGKWHLCYYLKKPGGTSNIIVLALTKNGVPILNPQEAQFQYGPLPIIWDMKRKQVHELWKAKNLPIVKTEKDTEIYRFVSGKVKFDIECGFSNGKLCKYRVRQLDKVNGMFPIDSNWVSKSEYGLQLKK